MDMELYMECDEEELQPWQMIDDSVDEDDMDPYGELNSSATVSCSEASPIRTPARSPALRASSPLGSSLPPLPPLSSSPLIQPSTSSLTPPPLSPDSSCLPPPSSIVSYSLSQPIASSSLPPSSSSSSVTLPIVSSSLPPPPTSSSFTLSIASSSSVPQSSIVVSSLPQTSVVSSSVPQSSIVVSSSSSSLPTKPLTVTSSSTLVKQGSPFILTQTANGAFLVPAPSGTGATQPILLTAQGFPVQMGAGSPLVLNLQTGQTMQPLTLIQSPASLGQLVRPGVGVSPVLPQARPALSGGSALTAVQLPTSLMLRTTTPGTVNLQMTSVGGVNSFKLAGYPALPSGSANGVTRIVTQNNGSSIAVCPTSSATRIVMTVEEFYYGTHEGNLEMRNFPESDIETVSFTCHTCCYPAETNLRLMQHMLQHSELAGTEGGSFEEKKSCRYCFRLFSSSLHLKSHQEQVHMPGNSSCMCRICEWAFQNEPSYLNHMKTYHKPGEMPYVCGVCAYRSSFYSNVLQHFANFHRGSRFLLCVFCFRVTRNPTSYQQHLLRHKKSQAFHCNRCRLQFVLLKEKMQHKLEHHRSFRRPARLDGLPPGSKVTIRTYSKVRQQPAPDRSSLIQPINIKTEVMKSPVGVTPVSSSDSLTSRRLHMLRGATTGSYLLCLECGSDATELTAHYPSHVRCLLCPYNSCCSRAYAAHMINHHVTHSKDKPVPLHKQAPPCVYILRCSDCTFGTQTADRMADHLALNPQHHSATCSPRDHEEPDIQFCSADVQPAEGEQKESNKSWRFADLWVDPWNRVKPEVIQFSQPSGPFHALSKNHDTYDYFSLLFPTKLMQLIASETNAHAKASHYQGSGPPDWVPVTTDEIKCFMGLVVLMGVQSLPKTAQYWSWDHYDNSYTFNRAMSYERFNQIANNIRMGSFTLEEQRGTQQPSDPLRIFRPMLDILGPAMWRPYRPNCCLTIDRALLPTLEEEGGQTKVDPKTQPQVWLLCDSKSGYCHRFYVQMENKSGQDLGFTVVQKLMAGLENKHHQLYLASSLTSVPLMQKLLSQGIYASSSFPPPNPILPRELWDQGHLEKPGDFLQRQFGLLLATRWKDTKEMGCLSTNAPAIDTDTVWRRSQTKVGALDPISRPMAFCLLQENMRGVDICKQLLACNPLGGIPQDRHWRNLFWFLVNLSIVNAFILLRESRKENPPSWVKAGLFTQVNFRKHLGNQLAKFGQTNFDTVNVASSSSATVEGMPKRQRHRIVKLGEISRRCRTCILKNLRRESRYGCVACKAPLCNEPSCFWEFHGRSPRHKGSPTVGFLKDGISGEVVVEKEEDEEDEEEDEEEDVDQAMAPVEDLDFSDEEVLEELEDKENSDAVKKEVPEDEMLVVSDVPSAALSSVSKESDHPLNARQLRIALFTLCDGIRQACRVFSTDPEQVRSWLKEARQHLEWDKGAELDGVGRMATWLLSLREQQLPITETNLFHKASTLKKKGFFSHAFRISYQWAVDFLLQHHLGVRTPGLTPSLAHVLPPSLQAKVSSFREFTQKVMQQHQLARGSVAALDELCIFIDWRMTDDPSQCCEALQFTGSTPLVTVYLSGRADGVMLPALVALTHELGGKQLPECVLPELCTVAQPSEKLLGVWNEKVWLPQLSDLNRPRKSMLILNRHRDHLGDAFLSSISGTLPAIIPNGCSFHLQPLHLFVKPLLQRHLLARWASFCSEKTKRMENLPPFTLQNKVVQLLVDWLGEALAFFSAVPDVWKKSFDLTGLLQREEEEEQKEEQEEDKEEQEKKRRQRPEEVERDVLKSLTKSLLGLDAADHKILLEVEDEEQEEQVEEDKQEEPVEDKQEEQQKEQQEKQQQEDQQQEQQEEDGEETEDKKRGTKTINTEGVTTKDIEEIEEEKGEERMETEEEKMETEETHDRTEESRTAEEDSEEETKEEEQQNRRDLIKERRETRIVIGEEVGDEWKMTVKSRTEDGSRDES